MQRPDPGPDERVIGREGGADRRVGGRIGGGERGFEQPPGERRIKRGEAGLDGLAGLAGPAGPVRAGRRARPAARLAAVLKQLADLRGDPAVPGQAAGVVVDDHDQRVRLLAGVAEHADDLVAVAEGIGVDVAVGGRHRAHVLGPAGAGHAALHQRQRGLLGAGALPRGAQAGDAGQQRERDRAALPRPHKRPVLRQSAPRRPPGAAGPISPRAGRAAGPTRCRASRSPSARHQAGCGRPAVPSPPAASRQRARSAAARGARDPIAGQAGRNSPNCPLRQTVVYVGSAGSHRQLFRFTPRYATLGHGAPLVSGRAQRSPVPRPVRRVGACCSVHPCSAPRRSGGWGVTQPMVP